MVLKEVSIEGIKEYREQESIIKQQRQQAEYYQQLIAKSMRAMSEQEIRQYQLANAHLMANSTYVTTPLDYFTMRSAFQTSSFLCSTIGSYFCL